MKTIAVALCYYTTVASSASTPLLRRHRHRASHSGALPRVASHHEVPVPHAQEQVDELTQVDELAAPEQFGPDGFPLLPTVSTILEKETNTLKSVNSQAANLEETITRTQQTNEANLARQKMTLEVKLKKQEEENRAIVDASKHILADISTLKGENLAITKRAEGLQATNRIMRDELRALKTKLGVAREFVVTSLKATDDSESKELTVLGNTKHPSGEAAAAATNNGSDASMEDSIQDASFLALTSRVRHLSEDADGAAVGGDDYSDPGAASRDAGSLLVRLSNEVKTMQTEEVESEQHLAKLFSGDFKAGEKRRKSLLAKQHRLAEMRSSLRGLQQELHTAEDHLKGTNKQLEERLRGLGLFLQRLAHLTLAPPKTAPQLITSLPVAVKLAPPAPH